VKGLILAVALGEDAVVQSSGRHNPQLGGAVEVGGRLGGPWSLAMDLGVTGSQLQTRHVQATTWRLRPALLLNGTWGEGGWRATFSLGPGASAGASTWGSESPGLAWTVSPAGRFRGRLAGRIAKGTWVDGGMGVTGRLGGVDVDVTVGLRWAPGL
jgi:hypothetical protein